MPTAFLLVFWISGLIIAIVGTIILVKSSKKFLKFLGVFFLVGGLITMQLCGGDKSTTKAPTKPTIDQAAEQLAISKVAKNWLIVPEDDSLETKQLGSNELFWKDSSGIYHKVYRIVRPSDEQLYELRIDR